MVLKLIVAILFQCFLMQAVFAELNLELTRGVSGAIPIAVAPFSGQDKKQILKKT